MRSKERRVRSEDEMKMVRLEQIILEATNFLEPSTALVNWGCSLQIQDKSIRAGCGMVRWTKPAHTIFIVHVANEMKNRPGRTCLGEMLAMMN